MHPPLTHVAGICMRPALAFAYLWNSVQAASAVLVNLQALLEEFGKWSALQTIYSKPCCLQHMLSNSPAFNTGLKFLTISYIPTCMTITLFHHGLWLNSWHVGQGQGGNACRAAGTGSIFSAVYRKCEP